MLSLQLVPGCAGIPQGCEWKRGVHPRTDSFSTVETHRQPPVNQTSFYMYTEYIVHQIKAHHLGLSPGHGTWDVAEPTTVDLEPAGGTWN